MADRNDPIGYAKYVRGLASTERLLRQFLKMETGLGKNRAYERGHVFNFEYTQAERDEVNKLMDGGKTFDEAFDEYEERRENERNGHGIDEGCDRADGSTGSPVGESPE